MTAQPDISSQGHEQSSQKPTNSQEPGDAGAPSATFRDPAGKLQLTPTCALRLVFPCAAKEARAFLASSFCKTLERNEDLILSEVVAPESEPFAEAGELWLRHPRIDPISYPWEWSTGQWRAAAELTLKLAGQAIAAGWMLKDATPLNIVFKGARPVLVDVLSFEKREPHATVWLAYGQFVRTFLLPLVAERYLGWPLQATILSRDGYEPRTIYDALGPLQRLKPDLLDVVTLATIFESSSKGRTESPEKSLTTDPELAEHILQKRISRLTRLTVRAARSGNPSRWSGYQQSAAHYRPSDTNEKKRFVSAVLERCQPGYVLDIGANTGTYSMLAADAGAQVVALDSDAGAIDFLWSAAVEGKKPITALVANIARPTPAVGWRNREQLSLLERLTEKDQLMGKFDLVLMLAVIHHLILREQLPLALIADLCASLTRRWIVVEWVPPSDPMYQEWLRGRDDLYGCLSEEDLKRAFSPFFHAVDCVELGNHRILFLFERIKRGSETRPS